MFDINVTINNNKGDEPKDKIAKWALMVACMSVIVEIIKLILGNI